MCIHYILCYSVLWLLQGYFSTEISCQYVHCSDVFFFCCWWSWSICGRFCFVCLFIQGDNYCNMMCLQEHKMHQFLWGPDGPPDTIFKKKTQQTKNLLSLKDPYLTIFSTAISHECEYYADFQIIEWYSLSWMNDFFVKALWVKVLEMQSILWWN